MRVPSGSNSVDSHTYNDDKHWHWTKRDIFKAKSINKLLTNSNVSSFV